MLLSESIVLEELDQYIEKANRYRLVLPIGEDIKLFTSIIDKAVVFFSKK